MTNKVSPNNICRDKKAWICEIKKMMSSSQKDNENIRNFISTIIISKKKLISLHNIKLISKNIKFIKLSVIHSFGFIRCTGISSWHEISILKDMVV